MTFAAYLTPLLAMTVAQVGGIPAGFANFGAIGLVCLLLAYREERARTDMKEERTAIHQDNAKLREELRALSHQVRNLNRNILFMATTHAPAGVRDLAEKELNRINQQDEKP